MRDKIGTFARRITIKLKHIAQIKYSKGDFDYIHANDLIRTGQFSNVRIVDDKLIVGIRESELVARLYPHSDCFTLKQVFLQNEYQPLVSMFESNQLQKQRLKIIDAGANVGYTSAFLFSEFPDAEIVCVEPDRENMQILQLNFSHFLKNGQLKTYERGLMAEDGKAIALDRGFRDGLDHSLSVVEGSADSELRSVSIATIMREMRWDSIDMLKIDIEGSERFVFGEGVTTAFLSKVRTIAIEIHDEFHIRGTIYQKLRDNGFVLFDSGETTFGLNTRFVGE